MVGQHQAILFVIPLWGRRLLGAVRAFQIRAIVWLWLTLSRQSESSFNAPGQLDRWSPSVEDFIIGCTRARWYMSLRTPNLLTSIRLYQWYHASNSNSLELKINASRIRLISARLKRKVKDQKQGKRVQVTDLPEFLAEVDSEASDIESPCFKKAVGCELAKEVASRVDKPCWWRERRRYWYPL